MKNYDKTYWSHRGAEQGMYDALATLVPESGECPDDKPMLEAMRVAANLYYDLYNNGGWNYESEIPDFYGIDLNEWSPEFDTPETDAKFNEIVIRVDRIFTQKVCAAWHENRAALEARDLAEVDAKIGEGGE